MVPRDETTVETGIELNDRPSRSLAHTEFLKFSSDDDYSSNTEHRDDGIEQRQQTRSRPATGQHSPINGNL